MHTVMGTRASRTFRVLWMLEELGAPYEHVPTRARSEEVRALNPSGKVPVLVVDNVVISDSIAILTYLGDFYGALTYPAGTLERARQDALTHQILDEIESLLWAYARHSFVLPEELRVPEIKPAMKWEYSRNLPRISAAQKGPFLMGEKMTIPDILLTHCLRWAETAKFPEPDDTLSSYKARMEAREALQRTVAMP